MTSIPADVPVQWGVEGGKYLVVKDNPATCGVKASWHPLNPKLKIKKTVIIIIIYILLWRNILYSTNYKNAFSK